MPVLHSKMGTHNYEKYFPFSKYICLLFLLGCTRLEAARSPHIVYFFADDLGWNDVSFHGSKQIPTPNIDAIARDGIILNKYYVQHICSPSRGSLMTGKYDMRLGFTHFVIQNSEPWGLPLREKILPQYLKELQYSTHAVGKWHLGFFEEAYLPLERGFDSFFGYYTGLEDYYTHFAEDTVNASLFGLDLRENGRILRQYNGVYGADLFTTKAKEIILQHDSNTPLFLYFPQQAVHCGNLNTFPLQAPDKYVEPMVDIDDIKRKIFSGMVSALDHSVGEIFEALEISGMLDDTIFIFSTDNGGAPQDAPDHTSGSNFPLKGGKFTLWEGGVRGVSFIWSSILRQRSRIYNELMHISDWLPTILSAVGGPEALRMLPINIDGLDHWPSIAYGFPSPRFEILLNIDVIEKSEAVIVGRYKLIKGTFADGILDKWFDREGKVFNITDSCQTPLQEELYRWNYLRFLRNATAANILWKKYGRNPDLAISCTSRACEEQLEIKCGIPPTRSNCDNKKEFCLFDIVNDPCEHFNIAEFFPNVVAELVQVIENYKAVSVPPLNKPEDPAANPKLHGNVWVPWR